MDLWLQARVTRLTLFIAAVALIGACGESPPADSTCESDCRAKEVSVCGADDSVGFIGIGGLAPGQECCARFGPSSRGIDVLLEIGSVYVAISTSCDFWSYTRFGPNGAPGGVLRTGRLDATQASEVDRLLRLENWAGLGPVHGICCVFDGGVSSYHWGSRTTAWVGTPDAVGPPPLPEDFPSTPATLFSELREFLSSLGAPSGGAVRYSAVVVTDFSDRVFERAPPWPLETLIVELAATEDEIIELEIQGLRPPVHRAEGEQADGLRAIRTAARNGDFGSLDGLGFIPIQEPDGSRYFLYVRDVGSFESPEGVPGRDPLNL